MHNRSLDEYQIMRPDYNVASHVDQLLNNVIYLNCVGPPWVRSLTSDHLHPTTVDSIPTGGGDYFISECYPAGLLK